MNELRQEFEAHKGIAEAISNNEVYYNKDAGCYIATAEEFMYDSGYLNGAWWAYQEQHKKYEKINDYTAAQGESIKILNQERIKLLKQVEAYQKMLEMQKNENNGMRFGGYVEPMKYEVAGVVAEKELHHGEYLIDTSTLDKPQQNITIVLDGGKIEEIFMVNSNELHNNR